MLALAGCISQPIEPMAPSFATLRILREQGVPPLALGQFRPAGKDIGRSIIIRGSDLHAPKGSNFAEFLGSVFATDLEAAGKLDPESPLVLSGVLTDSGAGENMASGKARHAADITLTRDGATVFAKSYRVDAGWKSDFIGALAIPDAFHQYNALYARLAREVLADAEFIAAAKGATAPAE